MTTHSLRYDGAPYDARGYLVNKEDTSITRGPGKGLCSCGEYSEELPNGASRRRWHKWHKENVQEEIPVETEEAPVEESVGEPAEETTDEDLIGSPEYHQALPYLESNMANHFWAALGVKATREYLAANFPSVELSNDGNKRVLHLSAPDEDTVSEAVEGVKEMWAAAKPEFRTWKKENPDYTALDHTVKADRSKSYFLVRDFFINFGKNF